nr:MAG TPA: hypothetical protein [Crassvirales sp.]
MMFNVDVRSTRTLGALKTLYASSVSYSYVY